MEQSQLYPEIYLRSHKARAVLGGHPWVLDSTIHEPSEQLEMGTVVDLLQPNGGFIGRGLYNPESRIRVRILTHRQAEHFDRGFIWMRLDQAYALRQRMPGWQETNAYRLAFSEGDGLSGLIIDRYADFVVVQVASGCMLPWLEDVCDWLESRLAPQGILLRMDAKTAKSEGIEYREEVLRGNQPETEVEILEHGVKLSIDLAGGQKTGYYLDQRDNHLAAAKWCRGGRVLDVCCYLGGFSLAIGKHSAAESVLGLDSSQKAVDHARRHAEINGLNHLQFETDDCFEGLKRLKDEGRQFEMVILDPPRFAGSRHQVEAALRAYQRLNGLALDVLAPDGMLVTCSCSGRVVREDFGDMLHATAMRARRRIQVLEQRGAAPDHPFSIDCPESEYLKCFICRVL